MYRAPLTLLLLLAAATCPAGAQTYQRQVIQPYQYQSPTDRPRSGLDEEKGRVYQEQLRSQYRDQVNRDIGRDATGAAALRDTRSELQRVDRVLNESRPPVPSLGGATGAQPLSTDDPNLSLRGGGHPQPTPADIEQKLRDQRERRIALPELRPVFDLYGNRIQ